MYIKSSSTFLIFLLIIFWTVDSKEDKLKHGSYWLPNVNPNLNTFQGEHPINEMRQLSDVPDRDTAIDRKAQFNKASEQAKNVAKIAINFENMAAGLEPEFPMPSFMFPGNSNNMAILMSPGCEAPNSLKIDKNTVKGTVPKCAAEEYRSFDGACNNIIETNWGKSTVAQIRITTPVYDDGIKEPRKKGKDGAALPNPRFVSRNALQPDSNNEKKDDEPFWSHWFALFGQFNDHDFSNTPDFENKNCCDIVKKQPNELVECFPIDVTQDDFYQSKKVTCLDFKRSFPGLNVGCKISKTAPRQQQNQATSYFDASQIYGSSPTLAEELREKDTGLLKSILINGDPLPLLPNDKESVEVCSKVTDQRNVKCDFIAGDHRVHEITPLTILHILFLREHNRIVKELRNVGFSDPMVLYQETRKIIIAMLQNIFYREFLTIVFRNPSEVPTLNLDQNIPYDITVDATISNEFSTAAYRFGHSMINGKINFIDKSKQSTTAFIRDEFFVNQKFYISGTVDAIVRGLSTDHSQNTNTVITEELTNFLFKGKNENSGLDLPAFNIHRGREHGIASYNEVRGQLNLKRFNSFEDIDIDTMQPETVERLKKVYKHVDDIDLWVGGLCERRDQNSKAVGETFAKILLDQFSRMRTGDRFFHNHKMPAGSGLTNQFTDDQLAEIKKCTLSSVICRNTGIEEIQPSAMLSIGVGGPLTKCSKIIEDTKIDFTKFSKELKPKPDGNLEKKLEDFVTHF